MSDPKVLTLTAYEQSALADLCQAAGAVRYQMFGDHKEPTEEQLKAFVDSIIRFDAINWGTLYDKLHRSGANF